MSADWKEWEGHVVNDEYSLQRLLGSGEGSAAFFTQFGDAAQNATIKLVPSGAENSAPELARWERTADLSHPHLLRLFDAGVYQPERTGLLYVVMEYADESLAGVLRERPLQEDEVRGMLEPVLEALTYIHTTGLVHGHVKPANIMAVGDEVKLASDSICEVGVLTAGSRHTGPYDAPETQLAGESQPGDVWSLGVTLVEAFTQRLPVFSGPQQELVLPQNLPVSYVDVVRRCLALDPQRRPSVADVAARLRGGPAAVAPVAAPVVAPVVAPAVPAVEAVRRWEAEPATVESGHRGKYLMAGGAAILALGAILAGTGVLRHSPPPAPQQVSQVLVQSPAPVPARPMDPKPSPTSTAPIVRPAPAVLPQQSRDRALEAPPKVVEHATGSQILQEVLPEIPKAAKDTIHGTVKINVRAEVDSAGRVVNAKLDSPSSSRYLANLTLEAARRWQFSPGRSEWVLRFDLTRGGTKVRSTEVR